MSKTLTWQEKRTRFMHRTHARRAGRAALATAFVAPPEPRSVGIVERGQQLIDGQFLFSGFMVESKDYSIWDVATTHPEVADELQGCAWLDDLAAVGGDAARSLAQNWIFGWIDSYGNGRHDGWTPGTTGRRVMRWINHGPFLLRGFDKYTAAKFFESLARQTLFLARRWKTTQPGLPRFEALAGTIHASLTLQSMSSHADPAIAALAQDCAAQIGADGTIPTRQPQELLDILSLLQWTVQTLKDAERPVPSEISQAIACIVPTLRALRHADGGLARFHGGGEGIEGRLDAALFASGIKLQPSKDKTHMGFARLVSGRTTVIVDAAAPPDGEHSAQAHASTLAFELTSGRRPLIVNCGSGERFGKEWRRASRATPSHSTMMIEGVSSSHLGPKGQMPNGQERLTALPTRVQAEYAAIGAGRKLKLSQNGYQHSHGLTHARMLTLSTDGRSLNGEDLLTTLSKDDEATFTGALPDGGLPFVLRFHLHPDVKAAIDTQATAVSLTLKSGEIWVLRHDSAAKLSLAPSVCLQNRRLKPIPTQQVVLSGHTMAYATRVRWSLAKSQDTPIAVRDFVQADPSDAID